MPYSQFESLTDAELRQRATDAGVKVDPDKITRGELEGFVEEYERPLPPAPTTLVGKFSAFVENTTGYKLF